MHNLNLRPVDTCFVTPFLRIAFSDSLVCVLLVTTQTNTRLLAELKLAIEAKHAEDWRLFQRLQRSLLAPSSELISATTESSGPPVKTLTATVERLIRALPERSWSVVSLQEQLEKDGFIFKARNPHSSLNTALARLVKRQRIEVREQGSGRRASEYRAMPRGNAASLRGRHAASEARTFMNGHVGEVRDEAEEPVT